MTRRSNSRSASAHTSAQSSTSAARYGADDRAVLIGHDWGAQRRIRSRRRPNPAAFSRFVTLAVPPVGALARDVQLRPTQAVVLHLVHPAGRACRGRRFWSPVSGSRCGRTGRRVMTPATTSLNCVDTCTADNIANVIAPYRASFNPDFADPDAEAEALATMQAPPVPTLYLHGADDGAIGADLLGDLPDTPTRSGLDIRNRRRRRSFPASGASRSDRGENPRLARLAGSGPWQAPSGRVRPAAWRSSARNCLGTAASDHVVADGDSHHCSGGDIAVRRRE